MTSFDARLRMLGHTGLPLGVEVDLTDERLKITSGNSPVANWRLRDIKISIRSDGFHVEAEGEEVILNFTDELEFAQEIDRRIFG